MPVPGRKPRTDGGGAKRKQKSGKGTLPAASTGPFDITCPLWLNDYGKEAWNRIVPVLIAAQIIEAADYDTVAEYCDWYAIRRKAREELGDGAISKDEGKSYHQALNAMSLASKHMRQLMSEMGLTPTARMRLRGPGKGETEDDDGIGAYL